MRTPEDLERFRKYRALAAAEENVKFGGRLGNYAYFDMDMTIASAMALYNRDFASAF